MLRTGRLLTNCCHGQNRQSTRRLMHFFLPVTNRLEPAEALYGLYLLQASSTAAPQVPPWLPVGIYSAWCPWAAGEQPAPLWASADLQGASAPHLENLLSSPSWLQSCFSPISPPSQLLLRSSFSLL